MPEPDTGRPEEERRDERRTGDRRSTPDATRRAPEASRWARWFGIAGRDLGIILGCVAAIVYSVRHANPIFSGQPSIAASLIKALPVAKTAIATPKDTTALAQAIASPQFARDSTAFAADLVA